MAKFTITNTQGGARGVNTLAGPVMIEAGDTIEAELSDAEKAVAQTTGWFDIAGKAGRPSKADEAKAKAEADAKAAAEKAVAERLEAERVEAERLAAEASAEG